MKKESRIGLVLLTGILGAYLLIAWAKKIHFFSVAQQHVDLAFQDVSGLKTSDPVLVRGVVSGNVERIIPEADFVRVRIALDPSIKLGADASAEIRMKELMGGKQIVIWQGRSTQAIQSNSIIPGQTAPDFGETMAAFRTFSHNISPATIDSVINGLSGLAKGISALGGELDGRNFGGMLDEASEGVSRFNNLMGKLENAGFWQDMTNSLQSTNKLLQEAGTLTHRMQEQYEQRIDSLFQKTDLSLGQMQETLAEVNRALKFLGDPNTTAGKILTDPEFTKKLESTLQQLNQTLDIINKDRLVIGLRMKKRD